MISLPEIVINHISHSDDILDIGGKSSHLLRFHNQSYDSCSIGNIFSKKKSYNVVIANDIFGVDVDIGESSSVLLDVQCILENRGLFFCNLNPEEESDILYFESLLRLFAHTHNDYSGKVERIGEDMWKCLYRM